MWSIINLFYGYCGYGFTYYTTYYILYNHNIFPQLTLFYFLKNKLYIKNDNSYLSIKSNTTSSSSIKKIKYFDILKHNVGIEEFYQHLVKEFSSLVLI